MKVINTILLEKSENPSVQHKELMAEAKRVALLGGSFSIRHFFKDNWWEEIIIEYPEVKKC